MTFVTLNGQFMSQWVRKTDATRRKHDLCDTRRAIHVTKGAKNRRNTTKHDLCDTKRSIHVTMGAKN